MVLRLYANDKTLTARSAPAEHFQREDVLRVCRGQCGEAWRQRYTGENFLHGIQDVVKQLSGRAAIFTLNEIVPRDMIASGGKGGAAPLDPAIMCIDALCSVERRGCIQTKSIQSRVFRHNENRCRVEEKEMRGHP